MSKDPSYFLGEDVPREQKKQELIAAGWKPDGLEDGRYYYFWEPQYKEVIDPDNRFWGLNIDHAYDRYLKKKAETERKQARREGKRTICCNKCGANMHKTGETEYVAKGHPAPKVTRGEDGTVVKPEDDHLGYYGLIDAEASGSYFSDHLRDTITYRFNLCEACLVELFKTFQTQPDEECYM